jgi:hypothetical protein
VGLLRFKGLPLQHKVMPVPPSWPGRLSTLTVSSRVVVPDIERPMITSMVAVRVPCEAARESCCSNFINKMGMCDKCVLDNCPLASATDDDPCGVASCSTLSTTCASRLAALKVVGQRRKDILCGTTGDTACADSYACMREVLTNTECQGGDNSATFRSRLESHLDAIDSICSDVVPEGSVPQCARNNTDGTCDISL